MKIFQSTSLISALGGRLFFGKIRECIPFLFEYNLPNVKILKGKIMLKSFKKELIKISQENSNSLRNKIKNQVPLEKVNDYTEQLTNFIVSLPDMLSEIRYSYEKDSTPENLKHIYGFLLTYIYHPMDLISDEENGLFGYLDDAYLVALVYRVNPIEGGSFAHQIEGWIDKTKEIIPPIARKLDLIFEGLMKGDESAFNRIIMEV